MIPLESPVPEIGPPGSKSGGRKRNHGTRPAARLRKRRISHRPLPATRLSSTLLNLRRVRTWLSRGADGAAAMALPATAARGSLRGRPGRPSPSPPIRPRLSPSRARWAFRWVAGEVGHAAVPPPSRRLTWLPELREVGGEGHILGRPAVEAGLNACWWSGVPVGGRWTNPEPSTTSEETAHGVQAPAGDVLAKRPDWQAWGRRTAAPEVNEHHDARGDDQGRHELRGRQGVEDHAAGVAAVELEPDIIGVFLVVGRTLRAREQSLERLLSDLPLEKDFGIYYVVVLASTTPGQHKTTVGIGKPAGPCG